MVARAPLTYALEHAASATVITQTARNIETAALSSLEYLHSALAARVLDVYTEKESHQWDSMDFGTR